MQRPAIERLLEASSEDKIEEIVRTELCTEEGDIDFFNIGEQMDLHELTIVPPAFSTYVLDKHWQSFGIRESHIELIRALLQLDEFNILHLNRAEFEADDSKVFFAIT